MANWWESIEEPKTLKAALELLTAIRTNLVLRNEMCVIFCEETSGKCNPLDPSQRHAFHKFLDAATELRARIIGATKSGEYGSYDTIFKCRDNLNACGGSLRGCTRNILKTGDPSGDCLELVHHCADAFVVMIARVLPKLYMSLLALLKIINDNPRSMYQRCAYDKGVIYQWLTGCDYSHNCNECPFSAAYQLPGGFLKDDMMSNDLGMRLEATLKSLVGDSGCLRTLIVAMRKIDARRPLFSKELRIKVRDQFNPQCKCKRSEADNTVSADTNVRVVSRVSRSASRPTRVRSRRSTTVNTPSSLVDGRVKAPVVQNGANTGITGSATTGTTTSAIARAPPTAPVVPAQKTVKDSSGVSPVASLYTGFGSDNQNTRFYLHKPGPHVTWYDTSKFQEVGSMTSSNPNSNRTACGAAAGLLAVGCVGAGAAYVFDIGGFGTMVNGMF
ncbi:amino acid adenylation domain-containing protein [Babesia caballi]|uniref:Amino acid adenylation domain-containing protein n=1 Tax=Babesia caballi TaxID=5871 RepID=A0AAV4LS55_BABCB|nr:amino acid adenylation domain-containing protein [Babesia caballi]